MIPPPTRRAAGAPVRPLETRDFAELLATINEAAEAYRGRIPADCWHEPYMPKAQLRAELAAGVRFFGIDGDAGPVAVMGVQQVRNVELIRHAYVRPERQGEGLGGRLIEAICGGLDRQILVGTWAAATWAIGFYQAHGFSLLPRSVTPELLASYWTISPRQVETSVVLARPALDQDATRALIAAS